MVVVYWSYSYYTSCLEVLTGNIANEGRGEDSVQNPTGEMSQLEQRHEDVDGSKR